MWDDTVSRFKELIEWFKGNKEDALVQSVDNEGYGPRFRDEYLMSFIIYVEFNNYRFKHNEDYSRGFFTECLGALYNEYIHEVYCNGNCDTVKKQLIWLSNMQGWRGILYDNLTVHYIDHLQTARVVKDGKFAGRDGFQWGNYTAGSAFDNYTKTGKASWWGDEKGLPAVTYNTDFPSGIYPGFVIFTGYQNIKCKNANCVGW